VNFLPLLDKLAWSADLLRSVLWASCALCPVDGPTEGEVRCPATDENVTFCCDFTRDVLWAALLLVVVAAVSDGAAVHWIFGLGVTEALSPCFSRRSTDFEFRFAVALVGFLERFARASS